MVNRSAAGAVSPGGTSHHLDDTIGFSNGESGHAGGTGTFNAGSAHPRDGGRVSLASLGFKVPS